MPVPSLPCSTAGEGAALDRPGDDVRRRRRDQLIAAGAPVRLRRGAAGEPAYDPVAVGPGLDRVGAATRRGRTGWTAARHAAIVADDPGTRRLPVGAAVTSGRRAPSRSPGRWPSAGRRPARPWSSATC